MLGYEPKLMNLSVELWMCIDAARGRATRPGFLEQELRKSPLIRDAAATLGIEFPETPLERRGRKPRNAP